MSFLLCSLLISVSIGCKDKSDDTTQVGNWIRSTPFKGSRRSGAAVFVIDDKAYVALGYNGDEYFTDVYEYDISLGFWKTKSSFPGVPRERAVAFSINGKGYLGTGYNRDQEKEELKDFWEYDPETDKWTQLNDFGGSARYNAVGFSLNNKGYVGTGNDGSNYNGDFWEYDPSDDSWNEIVSYPGQKREEATAFILNGNAFICTGRNNGTTDVDFWEFNPTNKTWTNRTPTTDVDYYGTFTSAVKRYQAVSFSLNGMAYVATGISSTGVADNSVYRYDPTTQQWDTMVAFEGSGRSQAVAFVLDGRIFVGTGQSSSSRFDDIWEFRPDQDYNAND